MLAVQLPDARNLFRVNDLVIGHITGEDGFQQQIPYDAAAPNASWIRTGRESLRPSRQ